MGHLFTTCKKLCFRILDILEKKLHRNKIRMKISKLLSVVRTTQRQFSTSRLQMTKLEGKVAIVTASTQGIGLAIAQRLHSDGANVVISSRKAANVDEALATFSSHDKILGMPCHVGKIDILVSNAGTNPTFGPMMDCSEDAWDKIFEVNVKAAFFLAKEVAPHIAAQDGGSIVFISSIGGLHPIPMIMPYSVSKTALLGLTKALSFELSPDNIRVNCVAPGIIDTKFAGALTSNEFIATKALENCHIKRFGRPEDIGNVVSFLCSSDSAYITGENLVVAGGMPSRL